MCKKILIFLLVLIIVCANAYANDDESDNDINDIIQWKIENDIPLTEDEYREYKGLPPVVEEDTENERRKNEMEGLAGGIILTAFAYLLVPMIIVVMGGKYPKKKLKRLVIINGIVVWLIFSFIAVSMDGTPRTGAVILWSYVGYWILKKKCLEEDTEDNTEEKTET